REALGRGAASLSLGEGKGTLRLPEDARCAVLELVKLPVAEARSQLQALVFGMAERIESLERHMEGLWGDWEGGLGGRRAGSSLQHHTPHPGVPQPSQEQEAADPSSRKNRGAGSTLPARRKIPGESLINPGFKSKKAPSGVDFEDS
ncbi:PAXX protein, partial [Atlantisia rogersi]|nr:PAXX protein [Atlantisia rogersi]